VSAPRVVIVGGGFGGLFATRALARAPVNVVLVDKRNYHLFRPMLYQVATGLLSADQIAAPLRSIVSRQRNVEVLQDGVTSPPEFNTTTSDTTIGAAPPQGSNRSTMRT